MTNNNSNIITVRPASGAETVKIVRPDGYYFTLSTIKNNNGKHKIIVMENITKKNHKVQRCHGGILTIEEYNEIKNDIIKIKITIKNNTNIKMYKESKCVICIDAEPTIIHYECCHMCICDDCFKTSSANDNKCPLCRCGIPYINESYEMATNPQTKRGKQILDMFNGIPLGYTGDWHNN